MDNTTPESRGKNGNQRERVLQAWNRNTGDNFRNEPSPVKLKMKGLNDPDCFVMDGAVIKCDQMDDKINELHLRATEYYVPYPVYLKEEYPGQLRREIRRLSAVQAKLQTANRINFATVVDCVCQRDVDEGKAEKASIVSMGYCRLYEDNDLKLIGENTDKAREYGTCYCLARLASEWVNPRSKGGAGYAGDDYSPHRNMMQWSTDKGPAERLTMGATLLCTRGGRITIETSGQTPRIMDTAVGGLVADLGAALGTVADDGRDSVWDDIGSDMTGGTGEDVKAHIREILGITAWNKLDEWTDYDKWESENDWTELERRVNLVTEYIDEIKQNNSEYAQFLELLGGRESEGNGGYQAVSDSESFWGMYQIGEETFKQIKFIDNSYEWTDLAKTFGVGITSSSTNTKEEAEEQGEQTEQDEKTEENEKKPYKKGKQSFLDSEIAQEVAVLFALRCDYQQILENGDDQYIGQNIHGVEITKSGLIAAGHLIGCKKLHNAFIGAITWDRAEDGNHTKALDYMETMGGLDLDGILVGIE